MKYKIITVLILLLLGAAAGYGVGSLLLVKTVTGSSAVGFFLTRPLHFYVILNDKLHSDDMLDRLTAYHTLYDLGMVDRLFLQERYKQEEQVVVKRAILQVLSLHADRKFLQFLDEVYGLSNNDMKMEIVRIVKGKFPDKVDEFAQKHRVDAHWIHTDK